MKLFKNSAPKLKMRTALFKGSFIHNPVLTQIIGICPIVAAATRLSDALALSVTLLLVLVICEGVTSLLLKEVPRWIRLCFYTLISATFIAVFEPLILKLTPDNGAGLGIYLYLLSANALTVIRCEKFACKTGVRNSIIDAVASGIGYGAVAVIVGTVRELLNYGTLFSNEISAKLPVTSMSFAALVILGFLAALHRWIVVKYYPKEISDTFYMNEVWEKPVLKDPGLHKEKKKPFDEDSVDSIRPRHTAADEKGETKE